MSSIPKRKKRLTHPEGFMAALEANQEYQFIFDGVAFPSAISFTGQFYTILPDQYVIISHFMLVKPDQVTFGTKDFPTSESFFPLTSSSKMGEWYFDNATRSLSYMVKNDINRQPFLDVPVRFEAKKCKYAGCQTPVSPALKLPISSHPKDALFWSNVSTWRAIAQKLGGNPVAADLPVDYDSVTIPDGLAVVVEIELPKIKNLIIEGLFYFVLFCFI